MKRFRKEVKRVREGEQARDEMIKYCVMVLRGGVDEPSILSRY